MGSGIGLSALARVVFSRGRPVGFSWAQLTSTERSKSLGK